MTPKTGAFQLNRTLNRKAKKEKDMVARKKKNKIIYCLCGCGEKIESLNKWGYQRKYKHGHNAKGKTWKWSKNAKQPK